MNAGNYPLCRKDNIVVQELHDEVLIYDLLKNKALCLNQTSAMIWLECDGTKSVAEITRNLSKTLKTNVNEDVVWMALRQFKADNLLAGSKEFSTPLDGLTRREIVKRIGFASMIALPMIASVVAPSAIHAQSSCVTPTICPPPISTTSPNNLANGAFCLSDLNCLSGNCPTISMICGSTLAGFCNQVGNGVGASAPCCPCGNNLDCVGGTCTPITFICADL